MSSQVITVYRANLVSGSFKHVYIFFKKMITQQFEGTVMQTEKALTNYYLHVSKVS